MVADEQTHTLPAERDALDRFARFLGQDGRDAFAGALLERLRKVQRHYARLFEDAPAAEASRRALAFPPKKTPSRRSTSWPPWAFAGRSSQSGGAPLACRRISLAQGRISPRAHLANWCRC